MAEENPDDIPEIDTAPFEASDPDTNPDLILEIENESEWRTLQPRADDDDDD